MTKLFKRITAAVLAAASIGAMSATAAAETIYEPPVDWMAIHMRGAPTSVNKKYAYKMYTYGGGFDITCTKFEGDYDRTATVWKQYDMRYSGEIKTTETKIADMHAETQSPIFVENPIYTVDNKITFAFYASSAENCSAYGKITHH